MIRRAIIVLLILAAVGTGALGIVERLGYETYFTLAEFPRLPEGKPRHLSSYPGGRHRQIVVHRGGLCLYVAEYVNPPADFETTSFKYFLGFGYFSELEGGGAVRFDSYRMPLWFLAVVFLAYPAVALTGDLRRWQRRRRERHDLCLKCGYDLTGNVSGVCPECGTEVKQP